MKRAASIQEALDGLSRVLDPPMDTLTAMQEVVRLHWQPGQEIGEFFILKRKATYAKLGLKHVTSILAAQLPREVQNRVKADITDISDDLEHEDDHKLICTVKTELVEKGHTLNKGNRSFESMSKVAVVRDDEPKADTGQSLEAKVDLARGPTDVSYFRPKNRKRGEGCFICGGSHIWRYCNEKRCPACGQKGHLLK